jgi:Protein of unknown function (DUF3040)
MTVRNEYQRQLRHIEFGLLGSDPQLVAMMNVFSGLTAGQGMPAWEQTPTRTDRVREEAALVVMALVIAVMGARVMLRALAAMVAAVVIRPSARGVAFQDAGTRGREGA